MSILVIPVHHVIGESSWIFVHLERQFFSLSKSAVESGANSAASCSSCCGYVCVGEGSWTCPNVIESHWNPSVAYLLALLWTYRLTDRKLP